MVQRRFGVDSLRGIRWGLLLLLPAALSCRDARGGVQPATQTALPDRAALKAGWNVLRPGGETACADDSDYRFFVRSEDPGRLLLFFHGGGACWDAETCVPEVDSIYEPRIEPNDHPDRMGGIFDLGNPENPLAGYSMVVVPYCTGDVHLGDRDASYTLEDGDGGSRTYTIAHRGQVNAGTVLDWVYANFEAPRQILVTGSSAGGVATPFYAELVARHYGQARVIGLGDAAGGFRSEAAEGIDLEPWGIPGVVNRHPGWEEFSGLGIEDLYITASQGAPNLELYQVDYARDFVQGRYLELAGNEEPDVLELLRSNRRDIHRAEETFRFYTIGGYEHTVMSRPTFYFYETDGHRFLDWVAAILAGDNVPSVDCRECDRPDLHYTPADLRLIDRALELLSSEDRWDERQRGRECPRRATRRSLRCAVVQAARDLGESSAGSYPAFWDVVYTSVERLGEGWVGAPMIRYNNLDSTDFEDVRDVLVKVRDRVRAGLRGGNGD